MNILLTGLTGTVGSALAEALSDKYNIFALVRGGLDRAKNNSLYGVPIRNIINADITKDLCGLDSNIISFLKEQRINKLIHCGASTKFDESKRQEIWLANHQGTINVLELARAVGVTELHYFSTSYASTKRNPYEASKAAAEKELKSSGFRFSIYSPSVIIGHSQTGQLNSFNGYYGCLAGIIMLVKIARARLNSLYLPLYIDSSFTSTLNVVAIDWVVETFLKLFQVPTLGETYYLTHPNPPVVYELYKDTFAKLAVEGIKYNYYKEVQPLHKEEEINKLQKILNKRLKIFLPYLTEELEFPTASVRKALGKNYKSPPEISLDYLHMMIEYVLKANFSK